MMKEKQRQQLIAQGNIDAQASFKTIVERHSNSLDKLINACAALINAPITIEKKYLRLLALVDEIMAKIIPNTPCKKGCSYCCNLSVMVSRLEANYIAAKLGKPARKISSELQKVMWESLNTINEKDDDIFIKRFFNKPCSFLKDGVCSIYEIRPIACRLNVNISNSPELCNLNNGECLVPSIDLKIIDRVHLRIAASSEYGDIRDFFPKGKAST